MPAIAISNNDTVVIAWKMAPKIDDCLGFALYRKSSNGKEEALPAWVGFQGQSKPSWTAKTTIEWPVQEFTWRDLTAKRGEAYTYQIVPMVGTPGALRAYTQDITVTYSVTPIENREDFSAFFNRDILSAQFLSHQIPSGQSCEPDYTKLKDRIDQPGNLLRNRFSGQLRGVIRLTQFNALHYDAEKLLRRGAE